MPEATLSQNLTDPEVNKLFHRIARGEEKRPGL